MDAPPASPRARKDSSRRVSEAVRSLRQNLDRKYSAAEVVRPVSSKVKRQIAAFENPASALDRVEQASLSVRGTIAAFERSSSEDSTDRLSSSFVNNAPPMTPSRKAAVAARKVTRSQKLAVEESKVETGVPEPGQCSTPRVWPEVRRRKALFEANLSDTDLSQAIERSASKTGKTVGKKQPSSTRRSQRLGMLEESAVPVPSADKNNEESAADMMDVDDTPVSTPNPFIDDDEVEAAAAAMPNSGIFAPVPSSPARKSKRVASRTAPPPAQEPEDTAAPAADPAEDEQAMDLALPEKHITHDVGHVTSAAALTPRTPTKVVIPTSLQKAAIKTPVKSARKSARKSRAAVVEGDSEEASVPGTPSKVVFSERLESAVEDTPGQEIEVPVAPGSVRKSARKARVVLPDGEEASPAPAASIPTTPSKAQRAEAAPGVAAAQQDVEEPTTPRSVRKSARKPREDSAAAVQPSTPNRVTFAKRLESATKLVASQEEMLEPVFASPARKSARKPQPSHAAAVATAGRAVTTPGKVTFSRTALDTSSDEEVEEEQQQQHQARVPATPVRVSARLAAASPHVGHAQLATPVANAMTDADEFFEIGTPATTAAKTAIATTASTKRKRNIRYEGEDADEAEQQDTAAADPIAPAAESENTTTTTKITAAAAAIAAAAAASSDSEAAPAAAPTTPGLPPVVRKRRRVLEIQPTPAKKKALSSSPAPSSARRRSVKQQLALAGVVDSPARNWVSTPVSPQGADEAVAMDVDGEEDEEEEEEEEEEGEGGWLLSVFFKAARKVGLL
ncbi:hypothetical protein HDU86_000283 [Geranomyces michiganensis]|nr:hypothetical protein HDU86_000283 [Geranomyces michiganensis]